jgi:hypothetical protein
MKEIALHIMDIAENGIAAGAGSIHISVTIEGNPEVLKVEVEDNGKGMDEGELNQVGDPFYTSRTTRRVGMGIPLYRHQAEMAGGEVKIFSKPGAGTKVDASFLLSHPDRQPLGDLEGCWMLLVTSNPAIDWGLRLKTAKGRFEIDTSEIRSVMEIGAISGSELTDQIKELIRNNMEALGVMI